MCRNQKQKTNYAVRCVGALNQNWIHSLAECVLYGIGSVKLALFCIQMAYDLRRDVNRMREKKKDTDCSQRHRTIVKRSLCELAIQLRNEHKIKRTDLGTHIQSDRETESKRTEQAKRKKCIQLSNENAVFIAKLSIVNAIKYDNFEQIEWLNFFYNSTNVYLFATNFFPPLLSIHISCYCIHSTTIFCTTSIWDSFIVIETLNFCTVANRVLGVYLVWQWVKKCYLKFFLWQTLKNNQASKRGSHHTMIFAKQTFESRRK